MIVHHFCALDKTYFGDLVSAIRWKHVAPKKWTTKFAMEGLYVGYAVREHDLWKVQKIIP